MIGITREKIVKMPMWLLPIVVAILLATFSASFGFSGYNHGLLQTAEEERSEIKTTLAVLQNSVKVMAERQAETNDLLREIRSQTKP